MIGKEEVIAMCNKYFNTRRIVVLLILICIISTFLLLIGFSISHADHHCTGSSCPICAQINTCLDFLNNLVSIFCITYLFFIFISLLYSKCLFIKHFLKKESTLVGLKVQFNN